MPETLSKTFEEMSEPDRFTLAWWREQWNEVQRGYRGMNHGMNQIRAEQAEMQAAIKALAERCSTLEGTLSAASVEIGKLREEVAALHATVDKAREAFVQARKENAA